MKTPPFILGAALLFWGWQTGFLWAGLAMAAVLESSRLVKLRWHFTPTELHRVFDLCCLIFVGALYYSYNSNQLTNAVVTFVQWLPMVFFPFVAVQAYSLEERAPLNTFFYLLRRKRVGEKAGAGINVSFIFFALCLLSASAANARDGRFYVGLCFLLAIVFWLVRPQRAHVAVLGGLIAAVVVGGRFGHMGLREVQRAIESKTTEWIAKFGPRQFDVRESRTSMGDVGRLKLSNRIVIRVAPAKRNQPPELLRQASYTQLNMTTWYASRKEFIPVNEGEPTEWQFLPSKASGDSATIGMYLGSGRGLLSLPLGAQSITNLPVVEMEKNRLGSVRVANGPKVVEFNVTYGPGETFDSPADAEDLVVPERERESVARIVEELRVESKSPAVIVQGLVNFFQTKFRYSTYLGGRRRWTGNETPLSRFLLETRSGHCEYFASATVLLLRQLGIPARYATGYSVQESAKRGRLYLVRERHAHAWALANVDGHWIDVDTTPASWDQVEEQKASFFEPLSDWWAGFWFRFAVWRWLSKEGLTKYLVWLVVPLFGLLAWRIFSHKKRALIRAGDGASQPHEWLGMDSEFYRVEEYLRQLGFERGAGETTDGFLRRVERNAPHLESLRPLRQLVGLHYRYRFDPVGLADIERQALKTKTEDWLAREAVLAGESQR